MRVDSRRATWAAGAALAVAAAFLFRDVLFGGEVFFGRDVTPFFYPMKDFLARSVRDGDFPFWNPWILNGVPFFGSLQPGHLYPGSLLLYLLPMPLAFHLLVVVHYPLAGLGVYLLLRRWEVSRPAAVFGGIAFLAGGFLVSLGNFYNNLQTAAWLPWLLLTWDRFVTAGRRSDALWFALVAAVAFLGGGADLLAVELGLVFLYGLVAPRLDRGRGAATSRGLRIAAWAGAGLLALGLVAVQLLPFWELLGRSVRDLSLGLDFTAGRSLEPAALLHFLVPPALETGTHGFSARMLLSEGTPWLMSVYPGILVLVFAGFGAARRSPRRWWLFWGGVALVGVALGMGRHSPVYRAVFEGIPGIAMIRYPEKFLAASALALALMGARGFDHWLDHREEGRWLAPTFGGLAAGAGAAAGLLAARPELIDAACRSWLEGAELCGSPAGEVAGAYGDVLLRSAGVLAVGAVVTAASARDELGRRAAVGVLLVVLVVDLGFSHEEVNPSVESDVYRERPWASETLTRLGPDRRSYRYRGSTTSAQMGSALMVDGAWELTNIYLDFHNLGPNVGQIFGHLSQDGSQGVELTSVATMFTAALESPPAVRARLMRASNVRYYADPTRTADSIPGLDLVARSDELPIRIFEVRDPVPRAYLVSDYRTADGADDALRAALGGEFPLRESVVLTGAQDLPPLTGERGSVVGTSFEGDRVEVRTRADGRMLLVLTDRHYPGWRARVNGEPTPVLRANGQFRAVVVPAGESTVEMRYRPPHFRRGAAISLAGVLLWTGLMAYFRRREA